MTVHNHAVVWVDHRVAKVFYLGLEAVDERTILADLATPHRRAVVPPGIATFAPSPAITRPTAKSSRLDAVISISASPYVESGRGGRPLMHLNVRPMAVGIVPSEP